jgi:hypothetical protein
MNDSQLFIGLGVVQLFMAVWGGILAARSLPQGARKLPHVWAFIALGVLGVAFTIASGISNDRSANEAKQIQTDTKNSLKIAIGKLDTTQDQLTIAIGVLNYLAKRSHDPNVREVAAAAVRMVQESKAQSSETTAKLVNQAREQSIELSRAHANWAGAIEALDQERRAHPDRASEILAKQAALDERWSSQVKPLIVVANTVREQLLQRLRPSERTEEDERVDAFFSKSLAGRTISSDDLRGLSQYLRALAVRVPTS